METAPLAGALALAPLPAGAEADRGHHRLTDLALAPEGLFYIRFSSEDVSGLFARDKTGVDGFEA